MDLDGKISLVTGAGQGIGEGVAKVLAAHGSKVVLVDLNGDAVKKVSDQINSNIPDAAVSFQANLTDETAIAAMIEFAHEKFNRLDCICNNAAASKGIGPVEDYALQDVQATLDLTFTALWKCLQAEIKYLKQHGNPASIVNISSNSALTGYAFNSIYAASKAAVNNLTQSVAKELARKNIRVNAVCPGYTESALLDQLIAAKPEMDAILRSVIPMKRYGKAEEIAEAAVWLASDNTKFMTGQTITLDGGTSL